MERALSDDDSPPEGASSFLRPFLALFAFGALGVLGLAVTVFVEVQRLPPGTPLPSASVPVVVALSVLTPTLLLVVSVAVGVLLAPKLGFRSLLSERVTAGRSVWPALRPQLTDALFVGGIFTVVVFALDALFAPFIPAFATRPTSVGPLLASLPIRLLYGGITEELLLRWGFMTLVAWVDWRLTGRGDLSPALAWTAIVLSAVAFGVGHLPVLAASTTLTPVLVVRTVLLNALGGVGFGWLFWRRSLEAAMVAHATFHVVTVGVTAITVVALT